MNPFGPRYRSWEDNPPDPAEVITRLQGEAMALETKWAACRARPREYVPLSPEDPDIRIAVAAVLDEYEVDFLLCTLAEAEQLLLDILGRETKRRPAR